MNQQTAIQGIEDRLRAVAQARDLPASLRDQAQRYLSRLVSPVRVTLFGRPSPGKAMLLSAGIGQPLLPQLATPPTFELRYGDRPTAHVTRADGSVTEPGDLSDPGAYDDAILVVVERPVDLLRRISFLDVQADDTPADQRAAIAWAAPRTDIALWVSDSFDDADRALWAGVPDQIKDHAYLVLTAALPDQADMIRDEMMDEFHDIYSLALAEPRDTSGVRDLMDRLLEHARLGRQADADGALLFLRANETAVEAPTRVSPSAKIPEAPPPVPEPETPKPVRPELKEAATAPPTAEGDTGPEADRPTTRTLALRTPDPEGFEIYSAGLGYIRRRSQVLLDLVNRGETIEGKAVSAHCSETLMQLSDMLASRDETGSDAIGELTDTVLEAENFVVLMENEKGTDPALDALSILLQVRREFEVRLAA